MGEGKGETERSALSFRSWLPVDHRGWVLLGIFLILLAGLALYQIDPGPSGPADHYPDSDSYIAISQGLQDGELIRTGSFQYTRILVPLLASFIPLEIHAAFLLVNIVFIALSGLLLFRLLGLYGFERHESWLFTYLLVLMHPMIVYLTTPLVDAGALFFLLLGLYLMKIRVHPLLLMVALLGGALTKETILILVPVIILHELFEREKFGYVWVLIACLPAVIIQRLLVWYSTGDILTLTSGGGGIGFAPYIRNEVLGGNIELLVAVAPLIPLAVLGLFSLSSEGKATLKHLFPLFLPVLPVFVWQYFESRLLIVTYVPLFILTVTGSRRLGRGGSPYLLFALLFYLAYWVLLFERKFSFTGLIP